MKNQGCEDLGEDRELQMWRIAGAKVSRAQQNIRMFNVTTAE